MNTPLVSIIIPTYNRAERIVHTLKSIVFQTYRHIEIIVVDDGSDDNTPEVIRDLIYKYNKSVIKYFIQQKSGAPTARNLGYRNSAGEYIVFFDSDDFMLAERIEKQVTKIGEDNADCCACGFYFNSINGPVYLPPVIDRENSLELFVGHKLLGSTQSWMFARKMVEKVDGYDEDLACRQDLDLVFRIVKFNPKISTLQLPLSIFIAHAGEERIMNSWNKLEYIISKEKYHGKVIKYLNVKRDADLFLVAIRYFYKDVIPSYMGLKDLKKIKTLYYWSFQSTKGFNLRNRIKILFRAFLYSLYYFYQELRRVK